MRNSTHMIHVQLRCGGICLREYDQVDDKDDQSSKTLTTYMKAKPGANFAVHLICSLRAQPDAQARLECAIYLDGKWITSTILNPRRDAAGRMYERRLEGKHTNTRAGLVVEHFRFADLQTNDAPLKDMKPEHFKELGEVTIKLNWVRAMASRPSSISADPEAAVHNAIPEKCLKGRAISSHATLAAPVLRQGQATSVDVDYPYGKIPFAVYVFKYRTRKDLQIEGIIPRSPSPVPLEDRDPDQLNLEEMRQLLHRIREREASAARVKREGDNQLKRERSTTIIDGNDDDDDDEIEVTAGPPKRRRTFDDSAVEIVDLTGD